jgi:hypothetical protein
MCKLSDFYVMKTIALNDTKRFNEIRRLLKKLKQQLAQSDVNANDNQDVNTEVNNAELQQYAAIAAAMALTTPKTLIERAIAWCDRDLYSIYSAV